MSEEQKGGRYAWAQRGTGKSGKTCFRKSGEARMILLATLKFGILFLMKREITEMWEQKRRIT